MPLPADNTPRPTIIIDTREQTPLRFTQLRSRTATLYTGDYSFEGAEDVFAIERKTIDDFIQCCMGANRDRFRHEINRLNGYWFKRLLIIGDPADIETGNYRSQIKPLSVINHIESIETTITTTILPTPEAAALQIEDWAAWFFRRLYNIVKPTIKPTTKPPPTLSTLSTLSTPTTKETSK